MNVHMRTSMVACMFLFAPSLAAETVHGKSSGKTKVAACANAKHDATRLCDSNKVSSFKQCECENIELANGDQFECSVDAVCEVPERGGEVSLKDPKRELLLDSSGSRGAECSAALGRSSSPSP